MMNLKTLIAAATLTLIAGSASAMYATAQSDLVYNDDTKSTYGETKKDKKEKSEKYTY